MPQQPDLLSPMLHLGHGALVVGRLHQHCPEAIGVGVARRQPKEQLCARVAKGCGEHGSDFLRLSPPLADIVDERSHPSDPLVAEAVEAPVHRSLSPAPQWPEGNRDRQDCEARHPGRAATESDPGEQRDDGVEQSERRR